MTPGVAARMILVPAKTSGAGGTARVIDMGANREMLIDLKTDPGEMKNLAADPAHNAVLTRLRKRLAEERK